MPDWPWHETRLARRTRIAHIYRGALQDHAPDAAKQLDTILDHYNQHWITGNRPRHIDPHEPMTAGDIAQWLDTGINNICNTIATHGIQPVGRKKGRKTYLLRDFEPPPLDPMFAMDESHV